MHEWTPVYGAATLPNQPIVRAAAGASARRALVGAEKIDEARLDELICVAMRRTIDFLEERVGPNSTEWIWGRIHRYSWPHPLGEVGHLGELLNGPALACGGSSNVINNVSPSVEHG